VWILLYVMMAVAGLVGMARGWVERAVMGSWIVSLQWLLNATVDASVFWDAPLGLAFAEIIVLWLVLAATMRSFWRAKKASGCVAGSLPGGG